MDKHELLQFFNYSYLPLKLHAVAAKFLGIAKLIDESVQDSPEKTECLRKLLESKDCALRSVLYKKPEVDPIRALEDVI